jgi:WD40 repeat protein
LKSALCFLLLLLVSSLALAATPGAHLSKAAFLRAYAPIVRGAHALAKDPVAYRASLARDPLALPQDAESDIGIFARGLAELRRSLDADAGLRARTRAEMDALVRGLDGEKEKLGEIRQENRKETGVRSVRWKPSVAMRNLNSAFYANERISLAWENDGFGTTHAGRAITAIYVSRPGQPVSNFHIAAQGVIRHGTVSPDGKTVYFGTENGELIERDLSDPDPALRHDTQVRAGSPLAEFVFSFDGKYLAFEALAHPKQVMVWDIDARKVIYTETAARNWGRSLRFSPDGHALWLTGAEGRFEVHPLTSGTVERWLDPGVYIGAQSRDEVRSVSGYSRDGKILNFSLPDISSFIAVRDPSTLTVERKIPCHLSSGNYARAIFSSNGRYLVAFIEHRLSSFRLLDLETGREVNGELDLPFMPDHLEFRDHDSVMYVHSAGRHKIAFPEGQVHVFKVDDLVSAYEDR